MKEEWERKTTTTNGANDANVEPGRNILLNRIYRMGRMGDIGVVAETFRLRAFSRTASFDRIAG